MVVTAIDDFERLCLPATLQELTRMKLRLATHVDVVAEAALAEPVLAVALARKLANGLAALVEHADAMTSVERSWVRGAIGYFLLTGDVNNDLAGPSGLDDDQEVFNEVCRRLGRVELMIA